MKNQTPTKMSRIRYVGGNNVKITNGTHFIHSEDSIEFSSLKKYMITGRLPVPNMAILKKDKLMYQNT